MLLLLGHWIIIVIIIPDERIVTLTLFSCSDSVTGNLFMWSAASAALLCIPVVCYFCYLFLIQGDIIKDLGSTESKHNLNESWKSEYDKLDLSDESLLLAFPVCYLFSLIESRCLQLHMSGFPLFCLPWDSFNTGTFVCGASDLLIFHVRLHCLYFYS